MVRNLEGWGPKAIEIYSVDGTKLENVEIEGVRAHDAQAAILIRLGARLRPHYFQKGEPIAPGCLRGVRIKDVEVELSDKSYREILLEHGIDNAGVADCRRYPPRDSFISGLPEHRIEDVRIENVSIRHPGGGRETDVFRSVPERPDAYPASYIFGQLPAYGLYCRHADGIQLRNVTIQTEHPDPRPMLVCDDVKNLLVDRVNATAASPRFPVIWLIGVDDAVIENCTAPQGSDVFVAATGAPPALDRIRLQANDTRLAATPLRRLAPGELVASGLPPFRETSPGLVVIEADQLWLVEPMAVQTGAERPSTGISPWRLPAAANRERLWPFRDFDPGRVSPLGPHVRPLGRVGQFLRLDRRRATVAHRSRQARGMALDRRPQPYRGQVRRPGQNRGSLEAGPHTIQIQNRESGTRSPKS